MKKWLNRVSFLVLGSIFVLGGIIGLFLPIIPGGLLLGIGVLMLSSRSVSLQRTLEKVVARFPALNRKQVFRAK
jgi:uncharacterized membrane protein YbaN (DUF454 family)